MKDTLLWILKKNDGERRIYLLVVVIGQSLPLNTGIMVD